MNNKKKLKQFMICLCCVFCSTALTIPYLSYATTQDDLDNANRELESLKAQQQSLSANLSEIDGQLQSAGSRLSSLEEQIDDKQADVDALNEELLSLSQTMDEQYDSMKLRIRYMYENSQTTYLVQLLESNSVAEFLNTAEYIAEIQKYDRQKLDEYTENIEYITVAKEQLEQDYADLENMKANVESQKQSVAALMSQKETELAGITSCLL